MTDEISGEGRLQTLVAHLENPGTEDGMVSAIFANLAFYQNIDTGEKVNAYAGSIYNWFIRECVQRNQYLVFPEDVYERIFGLYRNLVLSLKKISRIDASRETIRDIVRDHRRNLIALLRPIGAGDLKNAVILPCAEYTADLQLRVLGVDFAVDGGPMLDIGCGEKAALVASARRAGLQAVGIDQYQPATNDECVIRANWLEFDYRTEYWGTVVSHMAFSNHFIRASKTDPELAALYRAVFMEIIGSLKIGGSFVYTPALTGAEAFIDKSRYSVVHRTNIPNEPSLDTTRITRLRK